MGKFSMKFGAMTFLLLSSTTMQALAERDASKIIFGEGLGSCSTWTQARQEKSLKQGLSAQWVAGYMSGMNAESRGPDALSGTDFLGVMAWIDNYCGAHPDDGIGTAARALMTELRSRRSR
jgi:hypothetical protein